MAKPAKRKVQGGGRVTPKGSAGAARPATRATVSAPENSRYTPPVPHEMKVSPMWVPILMFALLGLGTLVILINYTDAVWHTSNWWLLGGLGAILGGIITATQYH